MVGRIKTKKKLFKISKQGEVRKTVDKGQFKGAVKPTLLDVAQCLILKSSKKLK